VSHGPPETGRVRLPQRTQKPRTGRSTSTQSTFDGRQPAAATAFAEIHITPGMLDRGLFLTDRALRQIRHECDGIDERGRVVCHLGPMRQPDELLLRFLAELPCPVSFGGNWQVAAEAQRMIDALRAEWPR
jgi:hypothetical protein